MKVNELGQIAKREVIASSPFAKLMQNGSCNVERESEGDTLHTVNSMKEAAVHYQSQTKELSLALKGRTLEETVNNIYTFLYSHFQYDADGYLQQLRSPNCSNSQRFTGIDCKSYSLYASTLLLNQNISHIIRRVKQRDYNPKNWSHVYIYIPIDQVGLDLDKGAYLIDGTLHVHSETPYVKKHDTIMSAKMPHVWLNGPAQNVQTPITDLAVEGFENFLALLVGVGVSITKVGQIKDSINYFLSKSINPTLKITNHGITIQGNYIPYVDHNVMARRQKKFFRSAISYASELSGNIINVGLNGEGDDLSLEEIEGLTEVVGEALDSNFFNNTFGAIFANGMNLSCWNSTFTPQQTSQQVNAVHIPAMRNLFNAVVSSKSESALQTALNALDKYTANANKFFWHERVDTDWQKCSRQALDIYTEYYREQYPKIASIINALETNFDITSTVLEGRTTIPSVYDHTTGPVGIPYNYKSYDVKLKPGVIKTDIDIVDPFDDGVTDASGGGSIDGGSLPPKQVGFNPVLGLFLVGGAIGTYLYTQSNKEKSSKNKIKK